VSRPSDTAVKTLFAHSRNLCFYERCEEHLTNPNWRRVNARIAHIKGEHPGSARYDAGQAEAERQGYENLMLLCPGHHVRIDDLLPDEHPVELLVEMRARHLSHVAAEPWCTDDEALRYSAFAIQDYSSEVSTKSLSTIGASINEAAEVLRESLASYFDEYPADEVPYPWQDVVDTAGSKWAQYLDPIRTVRHEYSGVVVLSNKDTTIEIPVHY